VSNKDTIIEALTIQLKIEREGNFALVKRIAELEKPVYVDSSRFSKGPSDHKPGMVITVPVQAIAELEKRDWVGMTDEERDYIWEKNKTKLGGWDHGGDEVMYDGHFADAVIAIEAKLKEKNT
jgi:hypothetical protein